MLDGHIPKTIWNKILIHHTLADFSLIAFIVILPDVVIQMHKNFYQIQGTMNFKMMSDFRISRFLGSLLILGILPFLISSCWTLDRAARQAVDQAVSTAVEQEVEAMLSGYTDLMLYQLAYTQMFHLGGFGLHHENFEEGQGATWEITSEADGETSRFTAERALLERMDDGSTWWYLKYTPEDEETIEYELLMNEELQAQEMYIRDPESGDIRHHEFDFDQQDEEEMEEGEDSLDDAGYHTESYYVDDWEEYHIERVTLSIGAGTFDADLLRHTEEEENFEFQWWVNEDIAGHLLQYEYRDLANESSMRGEIMEFRDDYISTLATR